MIRPHAYLPHGTPGLILAVCMVGYPWFILDILYCRRPVSDFLLFDKSVSIISLLFIATVGHFSQTT